MTSLALAALAYAAGSWLTALVLARIARARDRDAVCVMCALLGAGDHHESHRTTSQ